MLKLMPHQHVGADFLAARRYALLADEPGAGKTAQVVIAAWKTGATTILVLCPSGIKEHWLREFIRWSGREDATVVEGRPKALVADVMIVGHAAMSNDEAFAVLLSRRWDLIIVDEAHEFRNITSKRTCNLFNASCRSMWSHAERLWLLTGSPIVNSAADLYPMCASIFAGGQTIPYDEFIHRYTRVEIDSFGKETPKGIQNEHELIAWLQAHMLRRADFLDLPPRTIRERLVELDHAALADIKAMLTGLSPSMVQERAEAGVELADSDPISVVRRALGVAKAEPAAQHINALLTQGYGPIVVFYHHRDVRERLHRALQFTAFNVDWIDGASPPSQRVRSVDDFQAGLTNILLVQIQAGGVGLTLTHSNYCVVVEQPWTAIALEQAVARVHRMTQTRPVTADILTSECWLDRVMTEILIRKASSAKRLLTSLTAH